MTLEKCVWTDDDFEQLGWHDASMHAMAIDWDLVELEDGRQILRGPDLLFDIDYIVRWIEPDQKGGNYEFEVAAATLVFEDAWGIKGELEPHALDPPQLLDLHREDRNEHGYWSWHLDGDSFDMRLSSRRLRQHFRTQPLAAGQSQCLTGRQRGGLSFARPSAFS